MPSDRQLLEWDPKLGASYPRHDQGKCRRRREGLDVIHTSMIAYSFMLFTWTWYL